MIFKSINLDFSLFYFVGLLSQNIFHPRAWNQLDFKYEIEYIVCDACSWKIVLKSPLRKVNQTSVELGVIDDLIKYKILLK